ncbi:MAG: glycosyl transferase [Gammaproteobacteria bacterium]|nr:glycosyl transferase [Gammaproteobacteria bacterium]
MRKFNFFEPRFLLLKFWFIKGAVLGVLLFSAGLTGLALSNAHLKAPPPTLLLLDRHGHFLALAGKQAKSGYGYWLVDPLPERVAAAALALEDHRFRQHPGVDPIAVVRAAWQNFSSGRRISGASTIAMQVARMQDPGPRTYFRKTAEALTALFLTLRYGREEVLKHYLKLVPYGNRAHGIAYAARYYLDKPVQDLSWAEIAFLSAIPQAPGRMNPFRPAGRARAVKRGERALGILHKKGLISAQTLALARAQIRRLPVPKRKTRPLSALHAIFKFQRQASAVSDAAQSQHQVSTPRIVTTLDLELQNTVQGFVRAYLKKWRHKGANNAAVIVTRRDSREVLVWLGSGDYFAPEAGAIDFTAVPRSPGSALKPFLYALALDRGQITPNTLLHDIRNLSSGIANADRRFLGPLLPRQALANSRNVPAVHLLKTMGLDETYLFLRTLGLHRNERPVRYYGPGLAIGHMPVSLEHLVRAYGALSADGLLRELVWIRGQPAVPAARLLSAATARQITQFLADPVARLPSFRRMGSVEYPFPAAVKTGTSQDYRDAWTVAWSQKYLVGVWTGMADAAPMHRLTGANSAARLMKKILLHLHREQADGLADLAFPPPQGFQSAEICAYTGLRSDDCEHTLLEWFPPGQLPEKTASYRTLTVDIRNGLQAASWTPEYMAAQRRFVELPPRYIAWAAKNGRTTPPSKVSRADMPLEEMPISRLQKIPVTLRIVSPESSLPLLSNPDVPAAMNSVALRVNVDPAVPQVLWYVDGKPYKLADSPYTVRWPLQTGLHAFQARLPYRQEVSQTVQVMVNN